MAEENGDLSRPHQSNEDAVGYGRPPHETRFRKGQSGNPRGRPRNRSRDIPYDTVLGQMVTIRENGRERRVTAAEAFILQLTQKGLAGDSAAARASLTAIETARASRPCGGVHRITRVVFKVAGIGQVLQTLGIAVKKNPTDQLRVRNELQPWIVEAALARLGSVPLTESQQSAVRDATRTPHKVAWPEWWTARS